MIILYCNDCDILMDEKELYAKRSGNTGCYKCLNENLTELTGKGDLP